MTTSSSVIDSYPRLHQLTGKVLEGVAELLADPAAWMRGDCAATSHGEWCSEFSDAAVSWSLIGAIARVTGAVVPAAGGDESAERAVREAARQRLGEALLLDEPPRIDGEIHPAWSIGPLTWFNDWGAKTHGDIVALIRRATEAIEAQTADKTWERHPPFVENVVAARPHPLRVTEPSQDRAVDLPLHELVVPVCRWAGKWMDWADNEVVFGWSTARWHNHIETEGGCLLVPRSAWGPTDPEFVRCPRGGCVTHHDWNWIDAVADMDPAALKEHGLNALVCDWINAGNRTANRISGDHALFMAV